LINRYPQNSPKFITIEPYEAACVFKSGVKGQLSTVEGDLETMMAGLACGVPSTLAWPILRDHVSAFVKVSEKISGNGMSLLSQISIEAGECGAASYGLLHHLS
jgi:diaminopropionate ammonia-lyase